MRRATSIHRAPWPGEADFAALPRSRRRRRRVRRVRGLPRRGASGQERAGSDGRPARQASHGLAPPRAPSRLFDRGRDDALAAARVAAHSFEANPALEEMVFEVSEARAHGAAGAPRRRKPDEMDVRELVRRALDEDGIDARPDDGGHRARRRRGPGHPPGQGGPGGLGPRRGGLVFDAVDPRSRLVPSLAEGAPARQGDVLGDVEGPARGLLQAERVALNFLQRLCGVATLTRRFVEAVAGTGARIRDTRKTTPLLRALREARRRSRRRGVAPGRARRRDPGEGQPRPPGGLGGRGHPPRGGGGAGPAGRGGGGAAEQIEEALQAGAHDAPARQLHPGRRARRRAHGGEPRARGGLRRRHGWPPCAPTRRRAPTHRGGRLDALRARRRHLARDRARHSLAAPVSGEGDAAARPSRPARREAKAPGRRPIEHHAVLGSTNDRLKEWARAGAPDLAVVLADAQTAGRGRQGKTLGVASRQPLPLRSPASSRQPSPVSCPCSAAWPRARPWCRSG